MADEIKSPVAALTPSKGGLKNFWNILLWILAFALVIGIIYYIFFLRGISWKTIKQLIATESAKYSTADQVEMEHIVLQGCKEIIFNPTEMMQARDFAKYSNLPIEQVIVDNAIAESKLRNYIN